MTISNNREGLSESPEARANALVSSFASAFLSQGPTALLNTWFQDDGQITEYGPEFSRTKLPFLGTWHGRHSSKNSKTSNRNQSLDNYMSNLTSTLQPLEGGLDEQSIMTARSQSNKLVSFASGRTRWSSIETGQSWWETWHWQIEWCEVESDTNQELKIALWHVWADALSAWLAVKGDLKESAA